MLLKRAGLGVLLALGCSPCGGGLSVAGDTPFERCIARDPVPPPATIGAVKLGLRDRVLTLDGLPAAPRVAFFQGPGMATRLSHADTLRALAADAPDVMVVLGGVGMESKQADPWLVSLAKLGRPVLFLAGGRDTAAATAAVFASLSPDLQKRVVDATGVRLVNLSGYVLVLVAGADSGSAAIAQNACGFSAEDVTAVRASLDEIADRPKVLVSWEIPGGGPEARLPSASFGSSLLAELRDNGGFRAGVHAWPDGDVLRPVAGAGGGFVWGQPATWFEVSVPRIAGPAHERADGTRQPPGYVILRFEKAGIVAEMPR